MVLPETAAAFTRPSCWEHSSRLASRQRCWQCLHVSGAFENFVL